MENEIPTRLFDYGMLHRGVSVGAQPKGLVEWRDDEKYYSVITYSRELSADEIEEYELEYLGWR